MCASKEIDNKKAQSAISLITNIKLSARNNEKQRRRRRRRKTKSIIRRITLSYDQKCPPLSE